MCRLLSIAPARLSAYTVSYTLYALRNRLKVRHYLVCAIVKALTASFSFRQLRSVLPSTREVYDKWMHTKAKQTGLRPDIEHLDAVDSALLWLGDRRRATKFVIYCHGGGFVGPAMRGHMELCWRAFVEPGQGRVAVAMLQYSLSPGAKFPTQLRQLVAALGALLDGGIQPRDILVGGDSAGGTLTMQLVSHLLHPYGHGVREIKLAQPLAGVFLLSPWLSRSAQSWSYDKNNAYDMISAKIIRHMGDQHLPDNIHGQGLAAFGPFTEKWLGNLDHVAASVYLTGGMREVFASDILQLAELLGRLDPGPKVVVDMGDDEAHDFIVVECLLGTGGEATRRMRDWVSTVVAAAQT